MESVKTYNYQYVFNKVLNKRLKYVLNINLILSLIISLIFQWMPLTPSNNHSIWTSFIIILCFKIPVIFISLNLIRELRKQYLIVDYSSQNTLGKQIYHSIVSSTFLANWLGYFSSCFLIYFVLILFNFPFTFDYYVLSKEYRKNPFINDEWVYFWYNPVFISFFYTCNQLIFQRQRLSFEYGHTRNNPQKYLFKHLPFLLGNSIGLNLFIVVLTPFSYWFLKYYIYKSFTLVTLILGLDTAIPPSNTNWVTYFKLAYASFFLILGWEIANHTFNVYATIGCLDGSKPISTYSADPIQCLLSGLRDVDPKFQLSRLTAFQELAYLSKSSDTEAIKLRLKFFSLRSKKTNIWSSIFEECSLVIKETTDRINYRSSSDLAALKKLQLGIKDDIDAGFKKDQDLFGNSFISSPYNKSSDKIKNYETGPKPANTTETNKWVKSINEEIIIPIKSIITTFTVQYFKTGVINVNYQKYLQIYHEYQNKFSETSLGLFFRTTLKRDGESRIINPVNFGNAIVAISNLLQDSIEEDKYDIISINDVCNILNLLERPIRATSNYLDYLPASVYVSPEERRSKNKNLLIGILKDLSMHEFYQICLRFNGKLNDLILTPRTYKLAKWVIDKEIAIQEERKK